MFFGLLEVVIEELVFLEELLLPRDEGQAGDDHVVLSSGDVLPDVLLDLVEGDEDLVSFLGELLVLHGRHGLSVVKLEQGGDPVVQLVLGVLLHGQDLVGGVVELLEEGGDLLQRLRFLDVGGVPVGDPLDLVPEELGHGQLDFVVSDGVDEVLGLLAPQVLQDLNPLQVGFLSVLDPRNEISDSPNLHLLVPDRLVLSLAFPDLLLLRFFQPIDVCVFDLRPISHSPTLTCCVCSHWVSNPAKAS